MTHTLTALFLFTVLFLASQHFVFGALGPFALLAFDLGDAPGFRAFLAVDLGLEFFNQDSPGGVAVHSLGAARLAFDFKTGGDVF